MKNLEIESKLDANSPRAFARAKQFLKKINPALMPKTLHIEDVYLDHPAGDLARAKIAFRVRNTDGKWEATFKTRTEIKNGKAVRREATLPLPGVHRLAQALTYLEQKKTWKKIVLHGLTPRFKIINKRQVCELKEGAALLEIALDDVTICANGRQLKMKEIEIELKRGSAKMLDRFVQLFKQKTQLQNAKISKVKTAEMFLNLFFA